MIVKVTIRDGEKDHALGIDSEAGQYTPEKWERLVQALFHSATVKINQLREGIDEPWPKHL